jgi:FixJ family two-component response regulator
MQARNRGFSCFTLYKRQLIGLFTELSTLKKRVVMAAFQEPVYIVDDDLSFGKSLKRLLNARGLTADCFSSAQSFLDSVFPDQTEGIAVVDIDMPECDGFALMDKMHDLGFRIPVIVITGKHQKSSQSCAMERGAMGYLEKPFGEGSLLELI